MALDGASQGPVLALAGGVGGAKLAWGLAQLLPPERLTVVVNTGDDAVFHGLHVSPDLDTVIYTLAGLANRETGWGLAGDTFQALEMLKRYGGPAWFRLGDRDLATHIERTRLLRQGSTLSEVTRCLCRRLGVRVSVVPMSDQPVHTMVETQEGELAFQEYFVLRHCAPAVRGLRFQGAHEASISPAFQAALRSSRAIVFCPSNPFLSIAPILAVPGVAEALRAFPGPRVAVSPIVGGEALRGPASKIFRELGEEPSCVGVARRLAGLCDVLVIDHRDADRAGEVQALGLDAIVLGAIMESDADKERVAGAVLRAADERLER